MLLKFDSGSQATATKLILHFCFLQQAMPSLPCQCPGPDSGCENCTKPSGLQPTENEGPCVQNQASNAESWAADLQARLLCKNCRDCFLARRKAGLIAAMPPITSEETAMLESRDAYRREQDNIYYAKWKAKQATQDSPSASSTALDVVTQTKPRPSYEQRIASLEARVKELETKTADYAALQTLVQSFLGPPKQSSHASSGSSGWY